MTPDQQTAAERLVKVLSAENAALVALDYSRIGDFVEEKRTALESLNAASADATPAQNGERHALAVRLRQLLDENRELLGRAIKVQNRIMGVVAGAARQAQIPAGYGARGQRPRPGLANAVALIVRA